MAATKAEVAELVEELERYKGKHTEFITVYIPAGAVVQFTVFV